MDCCDEHEQEQWCSDPPRREGLPPEGFPAYNCCDQSQRQSSISEANMNLFAISDTRFPIFETLLVFFDHQHSLRIHQAFQEWLGHKTQFSQSASPCDLRGSFGIVPNRAVLTSQSRSARCSICK